MRGRFALSREFAWATLRDAEMKGQFALPRDSALGALREKPPTNITEKGASLAPYSDFVLACLRDPLFP